MVGLLYHLYNQFAFNTLGRVSPVSHGVCNVVKRICIIGSSVLFFGNKLSVQTQVGTVVALAGTSAHVFAVNGHSSLCNGTDSFVLLKHGFVLHNIKSSDCVFWQ